LRPTSESSKDGTTFHYAGRGQSGDQTLEGGDGSILNHREEGEEGRALRVFGVPAESSSTRGI
jgi:hypothetical protein